MSKEKEQSEHKHELLDLVVSYENEPELTKAIPILTQIHAQATRSDYLSVLFHLHNDNTLELIIHELCENRITIDEAIVSPMINPRIILENGNDLAISKLTKQMIDKHGRNDHRTAYAYTMIREPHAHLKIDTHAVTPEVTKYYSEKLSGLKLDHLHGYMAVIVYPNLASIEELSFGDQKLLFYKWVPYVNNLEPAQYDWFVSMMMTLQVILDDVVIRTIRTNLNGGKIVLDYINNLPAPDEYDLFEMLLDQPKNTFTISQRQLLLGHAFDVNSTPHSIKKLADYWSISGLQPLLTCSDDIPIERMQSLVEYVNNDVLSIRDSRVVELLLSSAATRVEIMETIVYNLDIAALFSMAGSFIRMIDADGNQRILDLKKHILLSSSSMMPKDMFESAFGIIDLIDIVNMDDIDIGLSRIYDLSRSGGLTDEWEEGLIKTTELTINQMSTIELYVNIKTLHSLMFDERFDRSELLSIEQKFGLLDLVRGTPEHGDISNILEQLCLEI